jgi:hypothetical protein
MKVKMLVAMNRDENPLRVGQVAIVEDQLAVLYVRAGYAVVAGPDDAVTPPVEPEPAPVEVLPEPAPPVRKAANPTKEMTNG